MPSGAKKRKAAAKKKVLSNNTPITTTGENEGTSSVRSNVPENRSHKNEDEGVVQIDRELKSEEGIEIIESPKELRDDSSSGSSSSGSGSDEECHVLEEKTVEVVTSPPVQVPESFLIVESDSSVKETESVSHVNESGLVKSGLDEIGETKGEDVISTSDVKDAVIPMNEDELLLSVNASRIEASNDVEHLKESETPECSQTKPLLGAAPKVVQTTSWKSCCGIFELFSGSNR